MFFPSDWGKTGKHQGNGGPKFVFLSFHSYFTGQEQPGTTHIFTKTIHGFVFSIPKMSVNASPNSFTTRHPSPVLLWKDWSGSLSIEYFTKLWILQTSSYFGRRHQPKNHFDLHRLYHRHLLYICPTISRPKTPTNPARRRPGISQHIAHTLEHEASLAYQTLFWETGVVVTWPDFLEGLLPIGSMGLAFTYLHGWLIFYGFHASKYTTYGSYVIYLPTIYLHQFRHPSVFEPMANVPLSLWVWAEMRIYLVNSGQTTWQNKKRGRCLMPARPPTEVALWIESSTADIHCEWTKIKY